MVAVLGPPAIGQGKTAADKAPHTLSVTFENGLAVGRGRVEASSKGAVHVTDRKRCCER
jgi:hypothetical protein